LNSRSAASRGVMAARSGGPAGPSGDNCDESDIRSAGIDVPDSPSGFAHCVEIDTPSEKADTTSAIHAITTGENNRRFRFLPSDDPQ